MSRILLMLVILAMTVAPAFADKVIVEFVSDPSGASVYEGVTFMGYAPVVLTYDVGRRFFKDRRCVEIPALTVRWVSSAEAQVLNAVVCAEVGKEFQKVIVRPLNVPGRELDVAFAIEAQRLAAVQAQDTRERRRQQWADFGNAWQQSWAALAESYRRQAELMRLYQPVYCNSYVERGYVHTTCY